MTRNPIRNSIATYSLASILCVSVYSTGSAFACKPGIGSFAMACLGFRADGSPKQHTET